MGIFSGNKAAELEVTKQLGQKAGELGDFLNTVVLVVKGRVSQKDAEQQIAGSAIHNQPVGLGD